jgi:hypothetical protein
MPRNLGYLRGAPDPRDLSAHDTLKIAKVPRSGSTREFIVDVLDQGPLGSCVVNGGLQAVRMSQRRQGAPHPPLGSRLWAYYLARAMSGMQLEDSGTYVRDFFQAITTFGFPPESAWPYITDEKRFKKMPGPDVFRVAYDQRAPTVYRKIFADGPARITAVKTAIALGFPVVFGTDVSEAFVDGDIDPDGIVPPIGLQIAGGHCLLVTSYTDNRFEVCNSWGTSWGDGGFCTFSAEYIQWSRTSDLWIVEAAPPFSD